MDLVAVDRIERLLERSSARARERIFTDAELAYCDVSRKPFESFAARFAAKEAFLKALGTGWSGGISWKDVECLRENSAPFLRISGRAAEVAAELGVVRTHVSLSHTEANAMAFVILEGEPL